MYYFALLCALRRNCHLEQDRYYYDILPFNKGINGINVKITQNTGERGAKTVSRSGLRWGGRDGFVMKVMKFKFKP